MHRRWLIQRTNREFIEHLSRQAGTSPAMTQIMVNRGLKSPEAVSAFLNAGPELLSDPFSFRGMREAVHAISRAKSSGTTALVHGDYDVDGITSAAITIDALKKFGFREVFYFIPNRFTHGYGFHADAVTKAIGLGAGLIITTDCGITAFETVKLARQKGLEVIVTDHHEPERDADGRPMVPDALAVIDPKLRAGEPELSGAGVAFKLAQALLGDDAYRYMDLAALGTIADLVPLMEENRILAREGLSVMEKSARPAFRALKEVSNTNREMSSRLLCYTLIPRLNAPGRLEDATDAVQFLLSEDEGYALEAAKKLDAINKERQRLEEALYLDAKRRLQEEGADCAIVLSGPDWHKGVLGIVASKFCEEFYRPTIILSISGDIARGSGRSIPDFDLYKGLKRLEHLLLGFGGHRQAAGVRLKAELIKQFRDSLSELVREEVREFMPSLRIDADISLREVSFGMVKEFNQLEPFGFGNPEPLLGAKELEVIAPRVVGNGHLKLKLRQKRGSFAVDAIGFDMASAMKSIEESVTVDAAFTPQINEWEGVRTLQLNLKGLRPSI